MRLIYFSPVAASSYAQRPHFMLSGCLDLGIEEALWVEPYPSRLPRWSDLHKLWGRGDQGTVLDRRIQVLRVPALPLEPLPGGRWLNARLLWGPVWRQLESFATAGPVMLGIGRPSGLAWEALGRLRPATSFYDAMDNFPEFHHGVSRQAVQWYEDRIAAGVDTVLVSSTFLAEKFSRRGLHVEQLLNACDLRPVARPAAQGGPIVLGYIGCLARWFDWDLLRRLAAALPQAQIELVGPCAGRPPASLPANVRLLPACPHDEVPRHLARFSAGLIPFCRNPLTAGVDPVKYYDYRAAGLPVLSTRFGEMNNRGRSDGVWFLDDAADLAAVVRSALRQPSDPAAQQRFCAEHNWEQRMRRAHFLRRLLPKHHRCRAA